MQYYSTHDLYIIRALAQHAAGCLPAQRKGFWQNIVQGFSCTEPGSEALGHILELVVLKGHCPAFLLVHLMENRKKCL